MQAYCPHCGVKNGKVRRELTSKELDFLAKIEAEPITEWYPAVPFPEKFDKDRITYKGSSRVRCCVFPLRKVFGEVHDEYF